MIIDPSMFSGPVSVQTWKSSLTSGSGCVYPYHIASASDVNYVTQPGEIYTLMQYNDRDGYWYTGWVTDYSMQKTDCINSTYLSYSGCHVPNEGIDVFLCFPPIAPLN